MSANQVLGSCHDTGSSVYVLRQGDSWLVRVDDQWAGTHTTHMYKSYQEAVKLFTVVDTRFRQQYEDYIAEARAILTQDHLKWIASICDGG